MTLLISALSLLAACPKPAEPAGPTAEVSVGPSPATPVSHLRCQVSPEGEYDYSWWQNGLETPYTGPVLDNGYTASTDTWECRVRAPDGADTLGSGAAVITGADVIPTACPNDSLDQPDAAPGVREEVLGGWAFQLYECAGQLATSVIYMRLDSGERDFAKYARVGKGRVTEFRPLAIPEELAEDHQGDPERGEKDWAYFAVWNNAGVCFRGCIDDWQFYAVQPDGLNLKIGEIAVRAGATPHYGFDDKGMFYIAERPHWREGVDLFALEDRRVLVRGSWEEVEEEVEVGPAEEGGEPTTETVTRERWNKSTVLTPERAVAVITISQCEGGDLRLPLHDPETGEATGHSVSVSPGQDWEVLDWGTSLGGIHLFKVKKGWQEGWTINQADPCGPGDGDAGE